MALRMPARIRYGIRILVEIGRHGGESLPLAGIETHQKISAKFAKQILQPLMAAGLVESTRGFRGGYRLLRTPQEIRLLDVVRALSDQSDKIAPCLVRKGACRRDGTCGAMSKWRELQTLIDVFLAETTLQDMMDAEPGGEFRRGRRRDRRSSGPDP